MNFDQIVNVALNGIPAAQAVLVLADTIKKQAAEIEKLKKQISPEVKSAE